MQLIFNGTALRATLHKLFAKYPQVSMAVAWASAGPETLGLLNTHRSKIEQAVIGTHFYQTHPDVLDAFVGSPVTRFMLKPAGVFHPKVYRFYYEPRAEFEIILGSANFTRGAMSINTELCTHFSHRDGQPALLAQTLDFIKIQFKEAQAVGQSQCDDYRRVWELRQPDLKKLEGQYGQTKSARPPILTPLMTMAWPQYLERVKEDKTHGYRKRLELLSVIRQTFQKTPRYADMSIEERKAVAGMESKIAEDAKWFGSMMGSGYFQQAVNGNNVHLSNALDHLPMSGAVTKAHFHAFIEEYRKAFPHGRDGIGTSSRLLALKRPDYFVCVDSKNRDKLTEEFKIPKTGLDYERYWEEIVGRLIDTPWWNSPPPTDAIELQAWQGRAAMLDALFYEE